MNNSNVKEFWIDLETTGVDPETCLITQIASVYVNGNNISGFECKVKHDVYPEGYNQSKAVEITGLTIEKLEKEGYQEKEAYEHFMHFLNAKVDKYNKDDKAIFSGFNNIRYDSHIIKRWMIEHNNPYFFAYFYPSQVDVLCLIGMCIQKDIIPHMRSYKLEKMCDYYGIELKAHDALQDIQATRKLYNKLMSLLLASQKEADLVK